MMKQLYHDGSGPFPDDLTPMHTLKDNLFLFTFLPKYVYWHAFYNDMIWQ